MNQNRPIQSVLAVNLLILSLLVAACNAAPIPPTPTPSPMPSATTTPLPSPTLTLTTTFTALPPTATRTNTPTPAPISLITPYVNSADFGPVREMFSSTANAPWGFVHGGLDFFPTGSLKPFQAAAAGKVSRIQLWANDKSGNWQVNVSIEIAPGTSIEYAFEPFTASQSDGKTQRDNILVTQGQMVAAGDLIGRLVMINNGSHVDFSFRKNGVFTCPETYFTPQARESVLGIIRKANPTWKMCY